MPSFRELASVLGACVPFVTVAGTNPGFAAEPPPGYRQLLPRGRIAAIDAPQYVTASKARLPGDAWVLGFVHPTVPVNVAKGRVWPGKTENSTLNARSEAGLSPVFGDSNRSFG